MDLASKVLEEIQVQKIKPKAKALIRLERLLILLGVGAVVFLGAYTLSLFLFTLRMEGGEFERGIGYMSVASERLPFLLILTVVGSIGIGFWLFRKTKRGYRAKALWLFLSLFLAVILGGVILDRSHAVILTHRFMMQNIPSYRGSMENYRDQVWNQPERGRISGVVEEIDWDHFILRDKNGHRWIVDDVDAHWREMLKREVGVQVKIMGFLNMDSSFDALHVLPWRNTLPGQGHGRRSPGIPAP